MKHYETLLAEARERYEDLDKEGLAEGDDWTDSACQALDKDLAGNFPAAVDLAPGGDKGAFIRNVFLRLKGVPNLSVIGQRIMVIAASVREGNTVRRLPSLAALSAFSHNYESNRASMCILSIAGTVLLVCGICGTLWCLAEHLDDHGGIGTEFLGSLGGCLWPGFWAMFGYCILKILSGAWRTRFEELLGRLDKLTLRYLFPMFSPLPELVEMSLLVKRYSSGNAAGGNLVDDLKKIQEEIQEAGKGAVQLREGMENYFSRVAEVLDRLFSHFATLWQVHRAIRENFAKVLRALSVTPETILEYQVEHAFFTGRLQRFAESMAAVNPKLAADISSQLAVQPQCRQFEQSLACLAIVSDAERRLSSLLDELLAFFNSFKAYTVQTEKCRTTLSAHVSRMEQQIERASRLCGTALDMIRQSRATASDSSLAAAQFTHDAQAINQLTLDVVPLMARLQSEVFTPMADSFTRLTYTLDDELDKVERDVDNTWEEANWKTLLLIRWRRCKEWCVSLWARKRGVILLAAALPVASYSVWLWVSAQHSTLPPTGSKEQQKEQQQKEQQQKEQQQKKQKQKKQKQQQQKEQQQKEQQQKEQQQKEQLKPKSKLQQQRGEEAPSPKDVKKTSPSRAASASPESAPITRRIVPLPYDKASSPKGSENDSIFEYHPIDFPDFNF